VTKKIKNTVVDVIVPLTTTSPNKHKKQKCIYLLRGVVINSICLILFLCLPAIPVRSETSLSQLIECSSNAEHAFSYSINDKSEFLHVKCFTETLPAALVLLCNVLYVVVTMFVFCSFYNNIFHFALL
jgi:hypothetical protein